MHRQNIAANALDKLIADVAANTPECDQCIVGKVLAIPVDERLGCNWKLSHIQGSHCVECLDALREVLEDFRGRFWLEVPAVADSMTTGATL